MTSRRLFTASLLALLIGLAAPASRAGDTCCLAPDNGVGTATLPPSSVSDFQCFYAGSTEIVDGLAPGSTIQISATIGTFTSVTEGIGGALGGTTSPNFNALMTMTMTGTGSLLGFSRNITINLLNEQIDWAPRTAFSPVQTAAAVYQRLQGQVTQDPDFDLLRITGGDQFGLPSPGYIQLVSTFGNWATSGFFDLYHRIDFIGASASPWLGGRSGSTTRQRRFVLCEEPVPVEPRTWSGIKSLLAD